MPVSSSDPMAYAASALPHLDDWHELWSFWTIVTQDMLPKAELQSKPIKLRNACIFYLGHIPAFLDVQLTKATGEPLTHPASYRTIFERGIDPDVDNPEKCHDHSEIPSEWPPLSEILAYQARVHQRLEHMYSRLDGRQSSKSHYINGNGNDNDNDNNHGRVGDVQDCNGQSATNGPPITRSVARAIWVGFEHEIMHIETLLYMMLQSGRVHPPAQTPTPNFAKMALEAAQNRVADRWFRIPAQRIGIGMDGDEECEDRKNENDLESYFGWDVEKPRRYVEVGAFEARGRSITVAEYAHFVCSQKINKLPASWTTDGPEEDQKNSTSAVTTSCGISGTSPMSGDVNCLSSTVEELESSGFLNGKFVRTVYGPVPLQLALDWPVFASYDELAACAAWMGGRIPTFEEAQSIYEHAIMLKQDAEQTLSKTVPAVNAHLINNGVQETPPTPIRRDSGVGSANLSCFSVKMERGDLYLGLEDANVGFKHWHPVSITGGNRDGQPQLAGQAELGGVWEWTSSVLAPHAGYKPMKLYPGYSADFFDGKHNIVLGGSWATHPRIAGRRTFVNWYQRNYPYPWVGARLVRDIKR